MERDSKMTESQKYISRPNHNRIIFVYGANYLMVNSVIQWNNWTHFIWDFTRFFHVSTIFKTRYFCHEAGGYRGRWPEIDDYVVPGTHLKFGERAFSVSVPEHGTGCQQNSSWCIPRQSSSVHWKRSCSRWLAVSSLGFPDFQSLNTEDYFPLAAVAYWTSKLTRD